MASGAEFTHRLNQIARIGGSMRVMTNIAFSLLNRGMNRPFLEAFFFLLMAGIAKRGASRGAQTLLEI